MCTFPETFQLPAISGPEITKDPLVRLKPCTKDFTCHPDCLVRRVEWLSCSLIKNRVVGLSPAYIYSGKNAFKAHLVVYVYLLLYI